MYYDYNDKELGLKNPKKMGYREQELNQNANQNATHSHIYINFKTISPKTLRKKVIIRKHIQ